MKHTYSKPKPMTVFEVRGAADRDGEDANNNSGASTAAKTCQFCSCKSQQVLLDQIFCQIDGACREVLLR